MNATSSNAFGEALRKKGNPARVATAGERERDFVIGMIALVLFLSILPHLFGYAAARGGGKFVGTASNIDDYLVYLSWLKETARGDFFIHNLFTTDPQPALLFNLLLSAIGLIMRVTHWSAQATIEFVRVIGSAGLLTLIYRFYRFCLPRDRAARLTAFAFTCFSSGFGWLTWRLWADTNPPGSPIDALQPEAYTFPSIYSNVLFVVSTILIVGVLYGLLLSMRTGKMRYAVIAGLCGFVMGNIHSYDVIHVCAAWGLFLVVWSILRWSSIRRLWAHSLVALALTMPTTYYVYHVFRTNPVFKSRAEAPTLTPSFSHYVLGYGLVFVFAVVAAAVMLCRRRQQQASENQDGWAKDLGWADRASLVFAWCWAIAGFLVIYVPVTFQRKMLMGEHIPLCLLAGWGAAMLTRGMSERGRIAVLGGIVAVSFLSNGFVIRRDLMHISRNQSETQQYPVLSKEFVGALNYIADRTPSNAAVLSIPFYAAYVPGFTGHAVWCGHWSETPRYDERVAELVGAFDSTTPDSEREAFLRSTGCRYLLYLTNASDAAYTDSSGRVHACVDLASKPPSYLRIVYSNSECTVFAIDLPGN